MSCIKRLLAELTSRFLHNHTHVTNNLLKQSISALIDMDNFSKLQALCGAANIYDESVKFDHVKATHVYEGTDSDDDEQITSHKSGSLQPKSIEHVGGGESKNYDCLFHSMLLIVSQGRHNWKIP